MKEKLIEIINKYHNLTKQMTKPEVLNNQDKLTRIAKEHSSLEKIVRAGTEYISILQQIDESNEILKEEDEELKVIAKDELIDLDNKKENLVEELKILLLPKDPNDDKN